MSVQSVKLAAKDTLILSLHWKAIQERAPLKFVMLVNQFDQEHVCHIKRFSRVHLPHG